MPARFREACRHLVIGALVIAGWLVLLLAAGLLEVAR